MADKRFRGRDKIVQKMTKDGLVEENLELEKKLDEQIRQMESTHPGYDEYRYQLDEIGHDPYQLISHLTAVYEQFTRGQVKTVIKSLFEQQYLLKVWETIEIRTRMETRVGIRPTIDAFGNVSMETYTYQEEVEYEYKILNVLLKNKGFDTIARKNMDRKQTGRYDAYNLTYGNRPELFGAGSPTYSGGTTGSIGFGGSGGTGGSSGGGFRYDIPEEALSDEKFARMIAEAEKYLGMKKIEKFLREQKPELLHYQKFLENGTAERAKESGTEQNYNMIDGCVNNNPKKPRIIGNRISVLDRLHIKLEERKQKSQPQQQQQQERSRKN